MCEIPQNMFELMDEIIYSESIDEVSQLVDDNLWLLEATAGQWNQLRRDNEYVLEKVKYELIEHVWLSVKRMMNVTTQVEVEETV